ncbi:MAG: DUF1036 domain-containing protein [Alphaproteobacteria bacterium]|nr:DUF1036 domain-containing protein [Alphaproteobacteria bacterium]
MITKSPDSPLASLMRASPWRRIVLSLALIWLGLFGAGAGSANADFRLCNTTSSRVGIALGYKDSKGWVTEGWWNISSRACETLQRGDLVARYYYVYAIDYDRGGEWAGQSFMCSKEKEFTIQGAANCLARGFDRTGFFEVDTGEQRSWTVELTDSNEHPRQNLPGLPNMPNPGGRVPGVPNSLQGATPSFGAAPPPPLPGARP